MSNQKRYEKELKRADKSLAAANENEDSHDIQFCEGLIAGLEKGYKIGSYVPNRKPRTRLTFDEAVTALEQSSFTICLAPIGGDPLVVISSRWEEEGDEDSDYVIEPEGCDAVHLNKNDTFKLTQDGRGFTVPGSVFMVFPNRPFNLRKDEL